MDWNPRVKVQSSVMGVGSDRRRVGHEGSWTDHPDVPALEFAKTHLKVVQLSLEQCGG